jgi:hypothetical protein
MITTVDEKEPLIRRESQSPPPIRKWRVFFIMALFGLTYLIPFDMVFTAGGYFREKFSETGSQAIEQGFPVYFQIGGITAQVAISLSSMVILKGVPIEPFVIGCNAVALSLFIFMTVLSKVSTETWPLAFFVLTTSMYCIVCGAGAMYKSGIMAIASMLHPKAVQGFILGQSAAGAINSLISLLTMSFTNTNVREAGFYYLFISCVCLAISLSVYIFIFNNMPYVKYNTVRKSEHSQSAESSNSDIHEGSSTETNQKDQTTFRDVFRVTWPYCAANCISLIITLLLFPAAISHLQPSSDKIPQHVFSVLIFLTFSVGDVTGALTSTFLSLPRRCVLPFCFLRLVFIPLTFMCNLQPRTLPVWFLSDYWPALLYFIMAWSNGVVLSIAATYCATSVESNAAKSMAGTLSAFSCALGLIVGSLLVFPTLAIL